jgi:hypothetical protein
MSGSTDAGDPTDILFSMVCPLGTVVDVTADVRFVEQEAPTSGPIPAAAILGQIYGSTLDGTGANGALVPVGLTILP